MAIENELKYVLRMDSERFLEGSGHSLLVQGYLPGNGRIRRDYRSETCWFNYKLPADGVLIEIEKEITEREFDQLWPHVRLRLAKRRYSFEDGDVHWDVDYFLHWGNCYFAMAEAEMPEGMSEPPRILPILESLVEFSVPRERGAEFSSKLLAIPPDDELSPEALRRLLPKL